MSQSRRYDAALEAFRRTFEHIGPPEILNADCYWPVYSDGFRDDLDNPLLLDMAIRQFDMARYLTGADAVAVTAESFRPSWSRWRGHASGTVRPWPVQNVHGPAEALEHGYMRSKWVAEGLIEAAPAWSLPATSTGLRGSPGTAARVHASALTTYG